MLFLTGLILLRQSEFNESERLIKTELREKDSLFVKLISIKGEGLRNFAYDYSLWDETIEFLKKPDPEWAKINIESVMPTFGIQHIWLYDTTLSLEYSYSTSRRTIAKELPLYKNEFKKYLSENPFRHFYIKTAEGIEEIRTSPLQKTEDTLRKGRPHGFLIAGRILSGNYIKELSHLMSGAVSIDSSNSMAAPGNKAGMYNYITLKNWDGSYTAGLT